MLSKYVAEYSARLGKHSRASQYHTDDPIALGSFLEELLDRGFEICAIKHEGVDLPKKDCDKLIKSAAAALASKRICASLHIKPEEERFRFGFAA
jgi:hypothetical protein